MRVANYFQMFRTKFTLQYPCNDMTPGITEMRENGFRQEQIRLKKLIKPKEITKIKGCFHGSLIFLLRSNLYCMSNQYFLSYIKQKHTCLPILI